MRPMMPRRAVGSRLVSCIVVLGARVTNGQPEAVLRSRLFRAAELARKVPGPVIVSGAGESAAMARTLVELGIDPSRIVEEDAATSTNENLENAWPLASADRLDVVTNEFHALRTRLWAWHLGIPVTVHTTPTPWRVRLGHWAREVVATPHSAARILWRRIRG